MTGTAAPAALSLVPSGPATPSGLRRAAPALLGYASVRLLGLLVLAVWTGARGKSPHKLLALRWDSLWYTRIAEQGYGYTVHLANGRVQSNLAFFPLLPWLERLIGAVTPLSPPDAGLAVSAVASLLAAGALFAIGDRLYGRRAGITLAVLWAALPTGIVQSMAYTESLFTALAAWSLYAVLRRSWLWAGLLAALAGLARPVGLAVVAAVWAAAAVEFHAARRTAAPAAGRVRLLLGAALAPTGWLAYTGWVGVRTGSLTGYADVQRRWGNGFDGGQAFAGFLWRLLSRPPFVGGLALCVGLTLLAWLYVRCAMQRQPLPLLVYTAVVIALTLTGAGYFGSKPRLLMPAFPLLLPIVVALARVRPVRAAATLGTVALASAVYGAFWLNGSGPP